MNDLKIQLAGNQGGFEPGAELSGSVTWSAEPTPRKLELRLFWFTRGKGIEDVNIIDSLQLEQPLPQETRSFRFRLPATPYSCFGTLVSVVWALELIAYPSKTVTRHEIEIGPGRKAVQLESVRAVSTKDLSVQFGTQNS